MEYVRLGKTGLQVSRLCLGCMTYGVPERGTHPWTLPEDQSRPFIKKALEHGINFFDTANMYSDGTSEEIVGRALRDFAKRDDVVIASKVYNRMHPGPNGAGLSRKAILREVEASLTRLGTDYLDLYQIHRWDYNTPIEETLETLDGLVRAGKVRYIGASSMHTYQFARALYTTDAHGWTRFSTMQNHYNLLYREEEREMLKFCQEEGVGVLPWSPLARGRLTREWGTDTPREQSDDALKRLYAKTEDADRAVVEAVGRVAKRHGVPYAQIALAWLLSRSAVTAPIVGASKPQHLEDAIAALELVLSDDDKKELEAAYIPHVVAGYV
jgi:aryl-alcohol dehydrogenase-like predicted oxidoreductase